VSHGAVASLAGPAENAVRPAFENSGERNSGADSFGGGDGSGGAAVSHSGVSGATGGRGLVETVDALIRHDGSPDAAARGIPVHVNTLRYRLDRMIASTGRDPRRSRDAFAMQIAFTLARTGAAPSATSRALDRLGG
jgi:hypothetical protein